MLYYVLTESHKFYFLVLHTRCNYSYVFGRKSVYLFIQNSKSLIKCHFTILMAVGKLTQETGILNLKYLVYCFI